MVNKKLVYGLTVMIVILGAIVVPVAADGNYASNSSVELALVYDLPADPFTWSLNVGEGMMVGDVGIAFVLNGCTANFGNAVSEGDTFKLQCVTVNAQEGQNTVYAWKGNYSNVQSKIKSADNKSAVFDLENSTNLFTSGAVSKGDIENKAIKIGDDDNVAIYIAADADEETFKKYVPLTAGGHVFSGIYVGMNLITAK